MTDFENVSTETLCEWLANCTLTAAQCLGHGKANANEQKAAMISDELQRRNIQVPDKKELYAVGIFNGKGSW